MREIDKRALDALLVLAFRSDISEEEFMNPPELPEDLKEAVDSWGIDINKIIEKARVK